MAADLVLDWQNLLRDSLDSTHYAVNDLMLLDVATKMGGVDSDTKEPLTKKYRELGDVPKDFVKKVLDGLQKSVLEARIDPMTPIGPIAATSISEPAYQGGMRTFHYAGVLTNKDELELLNIEVGKTPNKNALVALALPPDIRFDKNKAEKLAKGLKRTVLSDHCGIVKNEPAHIQLMLSGAVEKAHEKVRSFPEEERYEIKQEYSEVLEEMVEVTGKPLPAYKAVLDEYKRLQNLAIKAQLEAAKSQSYFIYLKNERMLNSNLSESELELALSDPNSFEYNQLKKNHLTDVAQLWTIINRQLKTSDGSFRTVGDSDNPLHFIWKNCKMSDKDGVTIEVGDEKITGIVLTFPYLTFRLEMGLMQILMRLEVCGNCKHPTTLAKLVHKAGRKGTEKVEDPEWDSRWPQTEYDATVVSNLLAEATAGSSFDITGVKDNPEGLTDEELERLQDESVGLIEIDMSTSDRYDFEIAELGRDLRHCRNCNHGWYNVNANVVQYNYGKPFQEWDQTIDSKDVEDGKYEITEIGMIRDYKAEEHMGQVDIAKHIGSLDYKVNGEYTIFPDDISFLTYPGASRIGQNSDYPLAFMHGGRIINDPIMDEYYILISYKDINDGRMNNFKGHFITASNYDYTDDLTGTQKLKIDFNRTTTSDSRQVELVLGIEAARAQLAHNMFNAQGNGKTILSGGKTVPVHFKHYLLLADSLCSDITMSNARSGSASVTGRAATKGARTEIIDGVTRHYQSVLAQAYERQTQVLLGAAPMGLIDDMAHPLSSQIAGQVDKHGTLGEGGEGKYGSVPTKRLLALKSQLKDAYRAVNDFAVEVTGKSWTGEADSILETLSAGGRKEDVEQQQHLRVWAEMKAELLAQDSFMELIDNWKKAIQSLDSLLGEYELSEGTSAPTAKEEKKSESELRSVYNTKLIQAPKRTKEERKLMNERLPDVPISELEPGTVVNYGANFDTVTWIDHEFKDYLERIEAMKADSPVSD